MKNYICKRMKILLCDNVVVWCVMLLFKTKQIVDMNLTEEKDCLLKRKWYIGNLQKSISRKSLQKIEEKIHQFKLGQRGKKALKQNSKWKHTILQIYFLVYDKRIKSNLNYFRETLLNFFFIFCTKNIS